MPSEAPSAAQHISAAPAQSAFPTSSWPRCCCETQGVCVGHPRPSAPPPPTQGGGHVPPPGSGDQGGRHGRAEVEPRADDARSSRRCPVCIPEEARLREAEMIALQQRCEIACGADRRRRCELASAFGPRDYRGRRGCYQSNTAEMLRRQCNSFYQSALDAEYLARRRALQAELDARRDEIAEMQRDREALRMEAALFNAREPQWWGSGRRCHTPRRGRSADPAPSPCHARPESRRRQVQQAPPPAVDSDRADQMASPPTQPAVTCPPPAAEEAEARRRPPPSRRHHARDWACGWAPWSAGWDDDAPSPPPGQWHRGWIWFPASLSHGGARSPSPRRHVAAPPTPPPPPAQPAPANPKKACAPPSSEAARNAAGAQTTPTAAEIVSMIAAGKLGKSLHHVTTSDSAAAAEAAATRPHPQSGAATAAAGARRGRGERRRRASPPFRSRSAAAAAPLAAPQFGRKVFITDVVHCDRRARFLAEWEARGVVQRLPSPTRSASAPLPLQSRRWRTTGIDGLDA
ncbi:hypothetical protein NESM_000009200 [Novymonas esmeraldas]|uniref:Uncharacterized protein n=1 Tax=Novymonas esmeraldas TaxID=1808958 RepID=A0AAW0F217_9TRYP